MTNVTSAAGICCLALSALLKGQVSFPGSQTYTASLESYFALQQSDISPFCIVSPQNAHQVSEVIHTLTAAISPGCQFAIRAGGHSFVAGASNIQGGVTVDLRELNSVKLSQDGHSVSVGAGATWDAVYSLLDPLNLSVVGGRVAGVGVGGLTIGGGISYFGPRYGWVCDMVLNFEIVLSNGSIVDANSHTNPDLRWALCGGGSNFGIVTKVDLQTFEQDGLWGGMVVHALSNAEEEILALSEFNTPDTYDNYSALISTFGYFGAQGLSTITNSMEYTKPVSSPSAFRGFSAIPALSSSMRITNMTELSIETASLQVNGLREATATLTIQSTVEALNATVQAWNASVPSIQDIAGVGWAIVLEPLPPAIYGRHAEDNALGLTGRQGRPLMVILLSMTWSNEKDDDRVDAAGRALVGTIELAVGKLGALDPFVYLNYAASWQKPILGYGESSTERLIKVQREYDPSRVFTDRSPGGFKLPSQ